MTTADHHRLLEAVLRNDLASFLKVSFPILVPGETLHWNWHLDAICHQLERVLAGDVRRLIIEVPPRSLKSIIASVVFPAFCLGRDPRHKLITASYSGDLAVKHANDTRALMRSARYRALFPGTIIGGKDTEADFNTTERGYRYSTSPAGTLTGRGGNMLILDDIMNPREAVSDARREAVINWYANTAFSRLNDKATGSIILVMQRLHMNDLAGHLREQGGFTILSLPAVAEEDEWIALNHGHRHRRQVGDLLHSSREPQSVLDELRRTIGSYNFSAQYQQRPVPLDGEVLKWSWFKRYRELPHVPGATIVQSWDVGMKAGDSNDYSVCTTWVRGKHAHYLIDVTRGRWDFPELLRKVTELARLHRADTILIEDKITGTALIQQVRSMRAVGVPSPIACLPTGDKLSRMVGESAIIEAGNVLLPDASPWLDAFRSEVAQFPHGRHDDQIDSLSQYLNWARQRGGASVTKVRVR
ncbi:phage terminase large subunit [Sphingomonas montana]|uniref:phage terminase large subunit n=1 Tax=Sphingomonas montana TaxID=1843236 RepID=UPI00096BE9B7|nr:phage terminase large subunit [Sphingomonas montana]